MTDTRTTAPELPAAARDWLDRALTEVAAAPPPGTGAALPVWERRFAEAGRRCGPPHAEAARVLLLRAARADTTALARVYRHGSGPERRAVLEALPHLVADDSAVPLVEDALRANDTALIAAALGPYAARHLDPHTWRHAVLKCLFTGVPVSAVHGLPDRARGDGELARMLADFAAERTAAGRAVPADLRQVLEYAAPTLGEES
ncbi:EboA domain-containing protein [Streptomyces sp. NPDC049954]|uniref:EboA domain-containing protein n=1 Tax=Streptomyces sp. NPDC049954 TaxID=3155779 RepID=UPI003449AACF